MTAHGDEVRRSTGAGPSFSASPALPKPHRCADSKSSYALPYPPQTARRQNNIAESFPALRNFFWKRYAVILLLCAALAGPSGGLLYYAALAGLWTVPRPSNGQFFVFVSATIAILWIPFGVTLGAFLEFVFRVGDEISFDRLNSINPGRWNPIQRFVNTVITGYCFAAILGVGALQVGVANLLLNDFISTKPYLSLAIGLVTGMSYPYVRDIIYQFRPRGTSGIAEWQGECTQSGFTVGRSAMSASGQEGAVPARKLSDRNGST